MSYRATAVGQRDGSPLYASNCRMAAGATGLDHQTRGAIQTTAADLRERQLDQVGGTDSGDLARAWSSYGQRLTIRDGSTWDDALADLREGRLVMLDVWHASCAGPCLSGSGRYGHTLALCELATDQRTVLVADPWCLPPRWAPWPTHLLKEGAEVWGALVIQAGESGGPDAVRDLMTAANPQGILSGRPDAETGGSADGGPILYTTTLPPGGTDVAIQAAPGLTSGYRVTLPADALVYQDADLRIRMRKLDQPETLVYIGLPIGEDVAGGSRAVLIRTAQPYSSGEARLTVGYIPVALARPFGVPTPLPPDLSQAIAARDEEWREWLLAGSPGDAP